MSAPPSLNSHQGTVHISVTSVSERREFRVLHTSEVPDCKKSLDSITIPVDPNVQLTGDIKIEFYSESHLRPKKKKVLFRFWFNTYFVDLENAGKKNCCIVSHRLNAITNHSCGADRFDSRHTNSKSSIPKTVFPFTQMCEYNRVRQETVTKIPSLHNFRIIVVRRESIVGILVIFHPIFIPSTKSTSE